MKLSEAGELGLLRELESRGLIDGTEHDAARARAAASSSRRTRSSRASTSGSTGSRWRELGFRAAAVNISDLAASAARPEALLVTLAAPATPRSST